MPVPHRVPLAVLALCAALAACGEQRDASLGPRGTALPPPGIDAPQPAAPPAPQPRQPLR